MPTVCYLYKWDCRLLQLQKKPENTYMNNSLWNVTTNRHIFCVCKTDTLKPNYKLKKKSTNLN